MKDYNNILHVHQKSETLMLPHRRFKRRWQYWSSWNAMWVCTDTGPEIKKFYDYILSYDDTWCEPFEGMDD